MVDNGGRLARIGLRRSVRVKLDGGSQAKTRSSPFTLSFFLPRQPPGPPNESGNRWTLRTSLSEHSHSRTLEFGTLYTNGTDASIPVHFSAHSNRSKSRKNWKATSRRLASTSWLLVLYTALLHSAAVTAPFKGNAAFSHKPTHAIGLSSWLAP